jgi:hypothetical protein
MLTQCLQCKKTYSTAIKILCYSPQERLCPHCEEMLGKLKHLGRDFVVLNKQNTYRKPGLLRWKLGVIFCFSLLLVQIYIFEKERFSQNPSSRLWLEKICYRLNCYLPLYKNRDDFEVMYGNFQKMNDQYYIFQAVISNQGKFKQRFPKIKLNLHSFSGERFAYRIFIPENYSTSIQKELINPSKTVEISMKIAVPKQKVGGYTFELI